MEKPERFNITFPSLAACWEAGFVVNEKCMLGWAACIAVAGSGTDEPIMIAITPFGHVALLSPESRSTCWLACTERSLPLLRLTWNKTVYFLKNEKTTT